VKIKTVQSWLQVLPTWALLGVFLVVPLVVLLKFSFQPADEMTGDPAPVEDVRAHIKSGEYLANYRAAFDKLAVTTYCRSLWVAGATTTICLVVSYPAAYYIARVAQPRWRNALLVAVAVPFWTSFVIRTSAWKLILGTGGPIDLTAKALGGAGFDILSTPTAVLIALVYGELPFMILPLYASLEKLDNHLLEAAADLGASAWRTFWRVTVPLTAPGIVAGIILVFIPSVGQYVVSDLMSGGKIWLSGNLIDSYFIGEAHNAPQGAAVSFVLMSLVLMMLMLYAFYARRGAREELA
jgi:spermidine/putrescine transport system permease protein